MDEKSNTRFSRQKQLVAYTRANTANSLNKSAHSFDWEHVVTEQRATEIGPIELMSLLEWRLRSRPKSLRNARRSYVKLCVEMYRQLEVRPTNVRR